MTWINLSRSLLSCCILFLFDFILLKQSTNQYILLYTLGVTNTCSITNTKVKIRIQSVLVYTNIESHLEDSSRPKSCDLPLLKSFPEALEMDPNAWRTPLLTDLCNLRRLPNLLRPPPSSVDEEPADSAGRLLGEDLDLLLAVFKSSTFPET